MATVTRTTTWSDNQVLTASALNGEFNNLLNALDLTNSDISAGANISISKIATGISGSIVGTTDTQTLTNKILTSPTVNSPTITGGTITNLANTIITDTDAATITFDLSTGNIHQVTLGGNRTLAISNSTAGQCFVIRIIQGGGSNTVTWFNTIKWAFGTTPTLTTTAGKTDVFGFICTSVGNFDGFIVGQNL